MGNGKIWSLLLPWLIRRHLAYFGAWQEVYNASIFLIKRVQKNDLGLIFGVPGSEWRCASFSFRQELQICEDLVIVRIYRFLVVQTELFQYKFGWWTNSQSSSWYYKWLLRYPHVKTPTKPNAGFNWHLFQSFYKRFIYFSARCCLIYTVNSMSACVSHCVISFVAYVYVGQSLDSVVLWGCKDVAASYMQIYIPYRPLEAHSI